MFLFITNYWYFFGILLGLFIFCVMGFFNSLKKQKAQKALDAAEAKFTEMAKGKTYDEIVAIMRKPQEEYDKVCPKTGQDIKVAIWQGGMYYWEQCYYDITVVFDSNGIFNNAKMSDN